MTSADAKLEAVLTWARRHRLAVAGGILAIGILPLMAAFADHRPGDVELYQRVANGVLTGMVPYREIRLEYPPYSIPIFVLPRLLGDTTYLRSFMIFAFLADLCVRALLLFGGWWHSAGLRALLPLSVYTFTIPFLFEFYLKRYDIFPALLCVLAIGLFCIGRNALSGVAIAVGIGIKVYPIVFVPPLLIRAFRQGRAYLFAGGLGVGILPIGFLSFVAPWWRFAEFHTARGLQVESLYASVLWFGKLLGFNQLDWAPSDQWFEVHGRSASIMLPWARSLFIAAVAISTLIVTWAASRCAKCSVPQIARLLLVPLLGFVVFNQVLSPQYMMWLLPLAALGTLEGDVWTMFAIAFATDLTPIFYPSGDYDTGLRLFATAVLLARNLILLTVWLFLLRETIQVAGEHKKT